MAAQQGFQYEKNAAEVLKKYNLVPEGFVPAGAGSDQPDLMLLYKGKEKGCELKITAASAGSLVLKYNIKNKKDPWSFGDIKEDDDEKKFLVGVADYIGLFFTIKRNWKEIPHKREKDSTWAATAGKLTSRQRYESDLARFPDIQAEIPAQLIEQYYNKKDTYYVNVGTHGFFRLGSSNPLRLKGVPLFSSAAKAKYRARVQYKGSDNYQFTFEMQFSMKTKSPFNIAPVDGKSVTIQENKLNLSCFII